MIRRIILPSLLFLACLAGSCGNSVELSEIDWLVGHWQGIDVNDLSFHERWERAGNNSLSGSSCTISPDGDTLWRESPKIEPVEGVPYYIMPAPGNKGSILYKMIQGDAHNAVFENKDKSFPQRISYQLQSNSTMRVKMEGIEKGQPKIQQLQFERVLNDSILIRPL